MLCSYYNGYFLILQDTMQFMSGKGYTVIVCSIAAGAVVDFSQKLWYTKISKSEVNLFRLQILWKEEWL